MDKRKGTDMSEDIKVSIIVPIHNGETFLRQTLDCIIGQTMKEIEILCVDDESTDSTVSIIKEYIETDSRIILFENKKTNAGAARNYAMQRARGKYLLFWDGDDLYELDAVELLYNQIEKDNADICVCNADHYDTQQEIYIAKPQYLKLWQLQEEKPFSWQTNGKYIFNFTAQVAWNKMFRRSFVEGNQIQFQEIPRINDHYFVSICMATANRITVLNKKLVHYRVNQNENLTSHSSETPLCKYQVQCDIKNKLVELGMFDDENVKQSFVNKAINTMIHGLNIQNNAEGYRALYDCLKNEGLEFLELKGHEEDYFYNALEFRNLQLIESLNCDEYLVQKGIDYRKNIENKNITIASKNMEIKEQNKQISQKSSQIQKLEKELQKIKSSKWYKLGQKVLPVYYKITGK